ncbi:MAG: glutamine--fructose-6-phosphate transaminase (isomerizing) [Candidatus Diapherotrites archaeon]|nr:glutamine--fructose-6-phosphate transaminase (isomerizing) [Candidatus Diapherotrites archaeon]
MCGIIGVKGLNGFNEAQPAILSGLKSLEYRGYDSWGIALEQAGGFFVEKKAGRISDEKGVSEIRAGTGIGHTRWATHGKVCEANAHPHLSRNGKIAVVHNGIIENYSELRETLSGNGFTFASETDTEVVPHLIESFMAEPGNDFFGAVRKALLQLEGSFAIVAMHADSDSLVCARNGSPLLLGVSDDALFAASDITAFLGHTKNAVYLADGEMALLSDRPEVFSIATGEGVPFKVETVDWNVEQAKKGNFAHFMLKEICEQPQTIRLAIEQDKALLDKATGMLRDAFGIFFVGCGTSYHACVSASYMFSGIAGKHVNACLASEFSNYTDFIGPGALVVAVSQSGETADLIDAVKTAKQKGAKVLCIVNVMGSSLSRLGDETLMMNAGPEICVLSTKSYTSQLAILLLLAFSLAGKAREGRALILDAASKVKKVISGNENEIKRIAAATKNAKDYFVIGRDLAFPSALEGALKIKEVSYIHAEGFAGGELKHGTIALVEQGVPAIVFSTEKTRPLILGNAMEIKSRGGMIIGLDSKPNPLFDHFIEVPEVSEANPILMIVPIQLLAYHLALERNCDPDKPRNLAKSVTVK